jgi:DNA-binding LacI/PurR family transcriptional regulator
VGLRTTPQGTRSRPTLEEVGAAAGVSRATVSRVVNGSPKVSPAVRRSVEREIARLGYAPNRAARALVTRRTDAIALVVSEAETRLFADPFFSSIVRGIGAAVSARGLHMVIVLAQDAAAHGQVERYLMQGHVDGAVLMSLHGEDPLPTALARVGVPSVVIGRPQSGSALPYVDADNRGGARAAVEHLIANGRRRIATIAGPLDMAAGRDRLEGYRDALAAAGIRHVKALVEGGDFTERGGERAAAKLVRRVPELDGVFVASDPMAAGALLALRAVGRRVPEDVAVVGFDDAPLARHTQPTLTTVRQPLDEMARATADMLFAQLTGSTERHNVVVPTTLVVRESA